MRKTRFMSLLFLVWSIAFFLVPDFRQALESAFLGLSLTESYRWLARVGALPRQTMEEAIRRAESEHDARTLAFAALHPQDAADASLQLADEAVKMNPQFTWIYHKVITNNLYGERKNPNLRSLVVRLETWDPGNAVPYLLEGAQIMHERGDAFPSIQKIDELAKETEWRNSMQKAFAAPKYDSYALREFGLDRQWLVDHDLAKPPIMLMMLASYPIPNLLNIRLYSNLITKKLGPEAEAAKHLSEAFNNYWTVAHMGERMQLHGTSLIERLIGISLQKDAYERLIPLLRQTGQEDAAASLDSVLQQTHQNLEALKGREPLSQSTNYNWAALSIAFLTGLVIIFGGLTLISVCYVNAKRWIRRDKKGRLYEVVTVAENYLTILLFLSCLGLYFTYYPYAQNFHHYMSAVGEIHDMEPFFYNVLPSPGLAPGTPAPIQNPLSPYGSYALIGLAFAVIVTLPSLTRKPKQG